MYTDDKTKQIKTGLVDYSKQYNCTKLCDARTLQLLQIHDRYFRTWFTNSCDVTELGHQFIILFPTTSMIAHFTAQTASNGDCFNA